MRFRPDAKNPDVRESYITVWHDVVHLRQHRHILARKCYQGGRSSPKYIPFVTDVSRSPRSPYKASTRLSMRTRA